MSKQGRSLTAVLATAAIAVGGVAAAPASAQQTSCKSVIDQLVIERFGSVNLFVIAVNEARGTSFNVGDYNAAVRAFCATRG